jgi:hypothetical protein
MFAAFSGQMKRVAATGCFSLPNSVHVRVDSGTRMRWREVEEVCACDSCQDYGKAVPTQILSPIPPSHSGGNALADCQPVSPCPFRRLVASDWALEQASLASVWGTLTLSLRMMKHDLYQFAVFIFSIVTYNY